MRWLEWLSWLVPPGRRRDWLEEWRAELWHLRGQSTVGGRVRFLLGAAPHAFWERKEEWTMETLWMDLRYAVATLRRSPGIALVGVLTVAVAVAANTSIFSLVNGLLLRPPAGLSNPSELVQIGRGRDDFDNFSYPAFRALAESSRTVDMAAFSWRSVVLSEGASAATAVAQLVSGSYFEVLGVRAARGRVLSPPDSRRAAASAVVSDALWRARFGADPATIGRTLQINRRPFHIVGILPPEFQGTNSVARPPDVFVPLETIGVLNWRQPAPELTTDASSWLWLVGRARDGASPDRIQAEMQALAPGLAQQVLPGDTLQIRVAEGVGLRPDERREAEAMSFVLLVVVGLVLLATCANLAGVFIARSVDRSGEVSVRMALGAGRLRLVRQLLTESALVSLAGAALAIPAAYWLSGLLPVLVPYPLAVSLEPDLRVVVFTLAIGLIAGLLFGLAPALRSLRVDLIDGLRRRGRTVAGGRALGRAGLVIAQLAVATALVSATGLLVRSVHLAQAQGAGFDTDGLLLQPVNLKYGRGYTAADGAEFFRRRLEELEAEPEIRSAAVASGMPISQFQSNGSVLPIPESQPGPISTDVFIVAPDIFVVSPDYFETLGIAAVQGRLPTEQTAAEAGVVINRALAQRLWPDQQAVGRILATALEPDVWLSVEAVVADVKHRSLRRAARPTIYLPLSRRYQQSMVFYVKAEGDSASVGRRVQAILAAADSELPLGRPVTGSDLASASLAQTRLIGSLAAAVALLALGLAGIGLAGLIAGAVARRRREMGIRLALGATPTDILRLFARWGLVVTTAGVVTGLAGALAMGQMLQGMLFGISSSDGPALVTAAVVLLLVGAGAALIPARRAANTNPVETLRGD